MNDRPNILFMHSHNTGTYIEPYGHAVPTPHLQQLAEQGVYFGGRMPQPPPVRPAEPAS